MRPPNPSGGIRPPNTPIRPLPRAVSVPEVSVPVSVPEFGGGGGVTGAGYLEVAGPDGAARLVVSPLAGEPGQDASVQGYLAHKKPRFPRTLQ